MKNQCMLTGYGSHTNQVSYIGEDKTYRTPFSIFPYKHRHVSMSVIGDENTYYSRSVIGKRLSIREGNIVNIVSFIG